MSIINEELADTYQRLVELEYEKLERNSFKFSAPQTFLTSEDILAISQTINISDLVSKGLIIPFDQDCYRTTHFDLIYRLIQVRNLERQDPIPLEFKIVLRKELVPDFGRYKISEILQEINSPSLVIECLTNTLSRAGYKGLSSYQYSIIKELLSGSYKNVSIVAPTASGKTLAFLIPLLVRSIERIINGRGGVACLLIYPRKALERDQLRLLLKFLDNVNLDLRANGKDVITIGIDDSDTPRKRSAEDGASFRKLNCVYCEEGELIIKSQRGRNLVVCNNCGKEYTYIIPTKDDIWEKKPTILITNMWIIYRRLLSSRSVNLFNDVDFVVIDEAHVYTHFLGEHISYILKMLRFVASQRGHPPTFVFSSATISNPKEFIASLAGISETELFYIDFQEALKNAPGKRSNRILLYLYLLPHPDKDIETLTEALILAVTLWCHRNNMKGITFIDSISEISTMIDYVHTTILGVRKGREITDHIFNTDKSPVNDYCWITLAPERTCSNLSVFKNFVLNCYKQSIDMHYGGLSLEKRAEIESAFVRGEKRMLLSTSTLELGIDLSDVAVIIQHKLPLTPEGVVQRVGRAGRNLSCYRIALGIIVFPALPLSTLYMFDERLRETLESISFLPPLRIGKASHNIQLQHTLSLLLLKRTLENKKTYIDIDTEGISADKNMIDCLEEIRNDLENLPDFNREVKLFEEEVLKDSINEFIKLLDPLLNGLRKLRAGTKQYEKVSEVSEIKTLIENSKKQAKKIKEKIKNLVDALDDIISSNNMVLSEVGEKFREKLGEVTQTIDLILPRISSLQKAIDEAIKSKKSHPINKWLRENTDVFKSAKDKLMNLDETRNIIIQLVVPGYSSDLNKFIHKLTELGDERTDLVRLLDEIFPKLDKIQSVDLEVIDAKEAFERIKNEPSLMLGYKFDLFQVLNLLFEGKIHFSLLLETPSPDFELVGVEEA
ncbi:MAG: DEAD/DEAH box helicase [Nitrososphaerota archaeon]